MDQDVINECDIVKSKYCESKEDNKFDSLLENNKKVIKNEHKSDVKNFSKKNLAKKRKVEIKATESRTLFVGNVPLPTKSFEIKKILKEFGPIEAIYQRSLIQKNEKLTLKMLSTDKKLSKIMLSKNIFVRFKHEKSAQDAAAKMNGYLLGNNNLQITLSSKREFDSSKSIFVGNLPFKAQEQELRSFFTENCGEVVGVRLVRDRRTACCTGVGYVEFKDDASILTALNLNEIEFKKRHLRISKILKKNKRPIAIDRKKNSQQMGKNHARSITRLPVLSAKRKFKETKNLADKISKFSTFNKNDIKKEKKSKKALKVVRKVIKKRQKLKKSKSLMN